MCVEKESETSKEMLIAQRVLYMFNIYSNCVCLYMRERNECAVSVSKLYSCGFFFSGSAICLPAHRHAVLHLCHHWNAGELGHDQLHSSKFECKDLH